MRTTADGSKANSGGSGSDGILRLLRFSFPYVTYIDDFYRRRPGLARADFETQDRELKSDYFSGFSDALTTALGRLGYDTRDYALTCAPLQKAWAREHGVRTSDRRLLHVAREQVVKFKPDVLFVNPFSVPRDWLHELVADISSIKVVVARHSSPRKDLSPFRACQLVLTGDSKQVDELREAGVNAIHLHHAFDARVLDVLPDREHVDETILFTGNINMAEGFHPRRRALLAQFARTSIPLEVRAFAPGTTGGLTRLRRFFASNHAGSLQGSAPLFGRAMFRRMRETAATLNVHGDVSIGDANNIRLWEAPGIGTCLLTDDKQNLAALFDVDREIVVYRSDDECLEKAGWLLEHPSERETIARAGQRRVLADHTFDQRAPALDQAIRAAITAR